MSSQREESGLGAGEEPESCPGGSRQGYTEESHSGCDIQRVTGRQVAGVTGGQKKDGQRGL